MISDFDIYRSARVLVQTHDNDAPIEAAMGTGEKIEKGDLGVRWTPNAGQLGGIC